MKNSLLKSSFLCFCTVLFSVLHTGCGLSIYEDWQASGTKALTGGGAVAGKDYVNGLLPSADSRKYFSKISMNDNGPIEKVSRTDDNPGKSGVRFVKNGGIVIPPGVTISYVNKGHCLDPHLPAPYANEEYQFIPASRLIPEDLQGIYKKLIRKAAAGDENIQRNMQHLVWALRTAGTDAAFANNLTAGQKQILNRCSEYSGQFEEYNTRSKQNSKRLKELLSKVDSRLNVKIGNVTYKASDLLDPEVGKKKINEHLNQLLRISKTLPVEHSGFNYGELQKGIYTDIRGAGFLRYKARIANSTNKEFIFYSSDYAAQVGSGAKSQGLTFFASANTAQRQRVTGGEPDDIEVEDDGEEEELDCSDYHKMKMDEIERRKKEIERLETEKKADIILLQGAMVAHDGVLALISLFNPFVGVGANVVESFVYDSPEDLIPVAVDVLVTGPVATVFKWLIGYEFFRNKYLQNEQKIINKYQTPIDDAIIALELVRKQMCPKCNNF